MREANCVWGRGTCKYNSKGIPTVGIVRTALSGSAADMIEVQHETVFFTGRVQGVGFRYQAAQAAKEYEVSGYVVNLPDGRVQLEAEGEPNEVDAFVTAVGDRMKGFVRKTERSASQRVPQYKGFMIR